MTVVIIQAVLVVLCGTYSMWRIGNRPNDAIARNLFGAAIAFFVSIWISLVFQ